MKKKIFHLSFSLIVMLFWTNNCNAQTEHLTYVVKQMKFDSATIADLKNKTLQLPGRLRFPSFNSANAMVFGGGQLTTSSVLGDIIDFQNGTNLSFGTFVPLVQNQKVALGFEAGFDYNNFKINYTLPTALQNIQYYNGSSVNGERGITVLNSQINSNQIRSTAFKALIGPSLLLKAKKFFVNPSALLGYSTFAQNSYSLTADIAYNSNGNSRTEQLSLFSLTNQNNNSFTVQTGVKIGYQLTSWLSVYTGAKMSFGNAIKTDYSYLKSPAGGGTKGVYEYQQLLSSGQVNMSHAADFKTISLNGGLALTIAGKQPSLSNLKNLRISSEDAVKAIQSKTETIKKYSNQENPLLAILSAPLPQNEVKSKDGEVEYAFEDLKPKEIVQPCIIIISPRNGTSYNTKQNLNIEIAAENENQKTVSYSLIKVSDKKDFWAKTDAVTKSQFESADFNAAIQSTGFSTISNTISIGKPVSISKQKLSEGSYKLIVTGSKECPAIVSLFAISSADVNITNFVVACGTQPGTYTYTLSANNPGSQPFSATSVTLTSPGGSITGVTTSPAVPAVTILPLPSPAVTITGTFNYTGSIPALVYVTIAGNQVGNVNLPSSDTEVDSLKQCLCNLCDKIKWLPSTPKVTLVGNNININQAINTYGYGTVIGVKAEIIAFERYVGDSCMSCNKDWNQWGNFTSGTFAGVAGVLGNAVTPVSGNTHHTMYWTSGSAGFPAISTFNMNISTPPLSNLSCCCEKLAVTIRYTYTYKPQRGECIICTQAPRRYIIQKGSCPKTTPIK